MLTMQTAPQPAEVESMHPKTPETVVKKQLLPDPILEMYLRMFYSRGSESRKDDWPPTFHTEYVNLVLVPQKKRPLAKSKAEDKIKLSVLGNIKDIAAGQRLVLTDILTSESDRVTIVNGGPGAGKTTLAKKLRREWANHQLFSDITLTLYVPLREPMARLSESVDDLLDHFGENCNDGDRQLVKGDRGAGILFILDGWDELRLSCRGEQQFFPKLIRGHTLPGSKVIVLSRPGASVDITRHADQVIEVLGFTREQVKDYIQNYYSDDAEGASKLIVDLEKYPNVASTCYVPINLAIVCHVYNALGYNLPPTITEVYQWFIIHTVLRYLKRKETMEDLNVDLPPIDEPKDFFVSTAFSESVKKNFNDSIIETLKSLGELAINGLQNDDLCFSRKQLVTTCKLDEQDVQFDGFGLLKPVQVSFCTRTEPYYHFLHLSIQEFIAGFYISQVDETMQEEYLSKIDHERYSTVLKHFSGLNQFESAPLRRLFERKERLELYHLESIHEGQWHDHCKEVARKCESTFRFEGHNLQPHQWEVLSYIMLRSGAKWKFECSESLLDVNGMVCFNRHLSESSQVLHHLYFKKMNMDHQAYVHVARVCQMQTGLTEIELLGCKLTDEGVFTIFEALESHPSLKVLRIHDDTPSAVASNGFIKLLPTLPSIQCVEVSIKNFRHRDYLDIIQCAKNCSPPPHVITPNDPVEVAAGSLSDYDSETRLPQMNPAGETSFVSGNDECDSSPSVTLKELVDYLDLKEELLDQRCQDSHLKEIASVLAKSNCVDMPSLKLTKADFNSRENESIIFRSLQAWTKKYIFKATYKCLVEELLSCSNAELAEELCNIVKRLSSVTSSSPSSQKKEQEPGVDSEAKEMYVPVKRTLDSKPKLHELTRLEDGDNVVSIIKMAASQWEKVATRLYFEVYSLSAIKRDNPHSVEGACMTVFVDWLRGMEESREPRTWQTVIKVLREADLSEVATKVEDILMRENVDM